MKKERRGVKRRKNKKGKEVNIENKKENTIYNERKRKGKRERGKKRKV